MPNPGLFDLYNQNLAQNSPDEVLYVQDEPKADPDKDAQKEMVREALLQAAKQRAEASKSFQKAVVEKNEQELGANKGDGDDGSY